MLILGVNEPVAVILKLSLERSHLMSLPRVEIQFKKNQLIKIYTFE